MTVTLSQLTDLQRVRIALSGLNTAITSVKIERSLNQLLWMTVRGGVSLPVDTGDATLDDYEWFDSQENFYRVTTLDPEPGLLLDGASGSYASTPDAASLDITGDLDLRAEVSLDDWVPASDQMVIAKWDDPGSQKSYRFGVNGGDGVLLFGWSTDGSAEVVRGSSVAPTIPESGRLAIRVTFDVDNGSGGADITFHTAPSLGGPWTQLGSVVTVGVQSVFAGSAVLEVGSHNAGTGLLMAGSVHAAEVRDGIDGTVVADPDFTAEASGTVVFDDEGAEPNLVDNPSFDTDVSGWFGVGLVRDTDVFLSSPASGRLTPDGTVSTFNTGLTSAGSPPVTSGGLYWATVWVRFPDGYPTVRAAISWRDSGGAILSTTDGPDVEAPAGEWVQLIVSGQAPASAASASGRVQVSGTPTAGDEFNVDDLAVRPFNGAVWTVNGDAAIVTFETASITPSLGGEVWLKSILYPFLNRALPRVLRRDPNIGRPSRSEEFPASGRSVGVATTDLRLGQRFTLSVLVETDPLEWARDMDLILASGELFFIHVPAGSPVPGGYVVIGDSNQELLTGGAESPQEFTLPCKVIAPPSPLVVGTTLTWGTVERLYGSWEALVAANATWIDLLDTVGSPEDTVVL